MLSEANVRIYDCHKKDRKTTGMLCRMGQMYAKILPNGNVYRCCVRDAIFLGNILDRNFKLLDEPQPCEAQQCPCWKSMLVGLEEDKWLPLWNYREHTAYKNTRYGSLRYK